MTRLDPKIPEGPASAACQNRELGEGATSRFVDERNSVFPAINEVTAQKISRGIVGFFVARKRLR